MSLEIMTKDALFHIIKYINPKDIIMLCCTNKHFNKYMNYIIPLKIENGEYKYPLIWINSTNVKLVINYLKK